MITLPQNFWIGFAVLALVLYWRFRRNQWRARSDAENAPAWLPLVDAIVVVLGAGAVVWMAVA